jgi:5-methyltetrahydrofolate--homocysteine methyltransferase
MPDFGALVQAVVGGDRSRAQAETARLLEQGAPPNEILNQGLIAGMDEVGAKFQEGELFIPEMLLSARVMHEALATLRPLLSEGEAAGAGRVVIGTVKGDLHDIGKKLVGMMLEGVGFEVIDLGIDVEPAAFVAAVKEKQPHIVGMSALLTTTMAQMKSTIDALAQAGVRDRVKIMIGGAAVSEDYARRIGADGYGPDAAVAVEMARRFMAEAAA